MAETFLYDVFLSHSSKDKAIVRPIAERLRADGLKVWFDEWEIKAGDCIPAKIEEGLDDSRVLVVAMSANAFGSDWAQLESGTFRFRDPLNKDRRFIPVRLDDATIKGSLAQFLYIDWGEEDREQAYAKLLEACRPPPVQLTDVQQKFQAAVLSLGHTNRVFGVAFSPDGHHALSGSEDNTARLWDADTGRCLRVLEGHTGSVNSVAFSPDGHHALSGANDYTVRLWDAASGRCLRVLRDHTNIVWSVAFSPDGHHVLSGAADRTVRQWDVDTGRCLRILEGHTRGVNGVAFSPDGQHVLSGADDKTVQLWDADSGCCLRVLKGHNNSVLGVAFSPDGHHVLSGAADKTVRLWDADSGCCLRVLEGHRARIFGVAFSADGQHVLSGADDKTVRLWDADSGCCLRVLEDHAGSVRSVAFSPDGNHVLSGAADRTVRVWDAGVGRCLRVFEGHTGNVFSVAFSIDGQRVLSGSKDNTARLWDADRGRCLRVLKGHTDWVRSVALSRDGQHALSGAADNTVRLWDAETGRCLRVLEGHTGTVNTVSFSSDGHRVMSGARDGTVRLWDADGGRCLRVLEGYWAGVHSVAFSPDGDHALSGADDNSVRLWDTDSGCCLRVLRGHMAPVTSVAFSPDGQHALSGAADGTVCLWEVATGRCLRVLEGHTGCVFSVAFSPDGQRALSGAADNTVRLWDPETGRCLRVLEGHTGTVFSVAFSPDGQHALSGAANGVMRVWESGVGGRDESAADLPPAPDQAQYTNAKVLLVGESGVGKTGLSRRLALNEWRPSDSTVGAWATHWPLSVDSDDGTEREIWLWDFGGQADQRLIHQLYMDETALAVLVFDGQKEDLFETLGQWDRDLARASRKAFAKLLVVARVDAGGLRCSSSQVEAFAEDRGYPRFLETSAKVGTGCEALKQAILDGIRWENIPWRTSPRVFKRLKEEIIRLKDENRVLMRFNELRDSLQLRITGEAERFSDEELKAVIGLLAGPGAVWELSFGSWVLLQPERVNAYAQAVIQTLREDRFERGCIPEDKVLAGDLTYQSSIPRLPEDEERIVLLAMHQVLVERALCLREHTPEGTLLIFPSYYRRERKELAGHPAVQVSYRFHGFLDDIYATLVVRLHYDPSIKNDALWRYAADFKTLTGKQLGVKLTRLGEGAGELEVYFDPTIPIEERIIFSKYVHEHVMRKAQDVVRLRHYVCSHCGTEVKNREVAMKRLNDWLGDGRGGGDVPTMLCVDCENRLPLWDDMEQYFASSEAQRRVRELQERSAIILDNESKERALVGDVISTAALAGQICREFSVSDHGIDMEIEFKNDAGEATGKRLYLQLKSGDSYLRKRKGDDSEIFRITKARHAEYWQQQAYPVMLVIRTSDGEIRWMDVSAYLKRESKGGKKTVKQIVFEGERFDVMSVRGLRDKALKKKPGE